VKQKFLDGIQVESVLSATGYEGSSIYDGDRARAMQEEASAAQTLALDFLKIDSLFERATQILILNAGPAIIAALRLWIELRVRPLGAVLSIYMLAGVGIKLLVRSGGLRLVEYDQMRRRRLADDFLALHATTLSLKVYATSARRRIELQCLGVNDVSLYSISTAAGHESKGVHYKDPGYVLLYVGDAKIEKGFSQLPELVDTLRRSFPYLQLAAHSNDPNNRFPSASRRLNNLAAISDRFTFTEGKLTESEYKRLFDRTALVILLHDRDYYHDMESGISHECLLSGTLFICRTGTLIANELSDLGGQQFCYQDKRDIPNLVARIFASYIYFLADFSRISAQFRNRRGIRS
jgi:hypothetical protein